MVVGFAFQALTTAGKPVTQVVNINKMKIKITKQKAAAIFYNGKFYDIDVEIDASFDEAIRLSQTFNVESDWQMVEYNPELFKNERFFNVYSPVDLSSGWGNVTKNLIKFSTEYKIALFGKLYNVSDKSVLASHIREIKQEATTIWHDQPKEEWLKSPFKKNLAIVPFETTRIPASWVERINHFDGLMVPCHQNAEAFKDSGVKVPIEVIHWGIDPELFYPLQRNESEVFTFGTMGALSMRKGTDVLVKAFQQAFPNEKDVKMICKTSGYAYHFMVKDPRIEVNMTPVSHNDLINDFFKKIDVFVFPTRGEGFGLPPLEAAASGVPVIVTNWSGPKDYFNDEMGWSLEYRMVPAEDFTKGVYKEDCGEWAEPSLKDLIYKMRHCYEHRDVVKHKGVTASEYVKNNWLWSKTIKEFHNSLNKFL